MKCIGIKVNGEPCQAEAHPGFSFCMIHRPDLQQQRAAGRKRGGQSRNKPTPPPTALPPDTPPLDLRTIDQVKAALGIVFNDVRVGRLDPKVGNCLAYIAATLVRAIEGSELEKKVNEILDARESQRRDSR